jgi:hypothetical protein
MLLGSSALRSSSLASSASSLQRRPNNAFNPDVPKQRFALLLHAG